MQERETLASRLGFILLSAGCAIGLGNVWRFPYITGQYGGAAFVLIYLAFLVMVGLPVMIMEFSIGRASRTNIHLALKNLEPEGTKWHWYGPVAMIANYILMSYYTVVTGWLLYYFVSSIAGNLQGMTAETSPVFFAELRSSGLTQFIWTTVAIAIGFLICSGGLRGSVEKASKFMMGALIILIIILAANSLMIPGSSEGLAFYLVPDIERLKAAGVWEAIFAAMSQAFFTLGLGIGSMEIFGSYIGKEQSLTGESIRVISLDTFVALFSGLIIFPACFAYGVQPGAGPGLLFETLPNIFSRMTGGRIWGSLFFLFMGFAAMTTLMAVFENIMSFWMDNLGWTRKKAAAVNFVIVTLISLPAILGYSVFTSFMPLGDGTSVLDLEDFIISSTITPLGSTLLVLFCAHRYGWGWKNFIKEADEGDGIKFPKGLRIYIKWILPLIILVLFAKGYWDIFSKL